MFNTENSSSTSLSPACPLSVSNNVYVSSRFQNECLAVSGDRRKIGHSKADPIAPITASVDKSLKFSRYQEAGPSSCESIITTGSVSQDKENTNSMPTLMSLKKENTVVKRVGCRDRGSDDEKEKGAVEADVARVLITPSRRYIIMFGLVLSVFLAAMDQTIVAVVLPNIGAQFDALSNTAWLGTAYLITITALQPLYGKLSDIFGRLQVLLFALGIFLVGSALCATAQSMIWLIISRGVTGIGGSGIFALSIIILSDITTIKNRGRYISCISFAWTIASVIGPLLGGVFADKVTWRWCFYINLPIGAVTVIISLLFLRVPTQKSSWKEKLKRIDFLGSLIIVAGLVVLLLALSWGGKEYPWNSAVIISLLVVGLVLLIAFVLVEAYIPPEPILKISLFKSYSMLALIIAILTSGMVMYSLIYYVPVFFSITQNASSINAGLHLLPFLVTVSIFALASGQLTSYTGRYRLVTIFGFLFAAVGSGIVTLLRPDSTLDKQIGYLILCGIGIGLVLPPVIVLGQSMVKPNDIAIITSFLMFTRTIGGVLGLAICDSVFKNYLLRKLHPIVSQHPSYSKPILDSQDNSSIIWASDFPSDLRHEVIDAYGQALRQLFIVLVPLSAIGFVASVIVKQGKTLNKKTKKDDAGKKAKDARDVELA
ncbi:hypothetical protein H4219_004153 [Mycoemilia scoparia]|uniref:Major facilitator superfamily (MFS) profile domain-containing protein n=1 Tax=Mycoemilia scoparia TaxID=417184 RepID=A0A9W7ZYD0_9FUNG|nr:hypothetical protein H4219_004153 [Mycoemilia scoparia]